MGKLCILNNRISSWLEREKKIVEKQGGFRAKRATSEQIFILKEAIHGRRGAKKKLFAAS